MVVLGAGVAGLAAAAALLPHVGEVLVVERDTVEGCGTSRPGVPQATQLHNLLGRAQRSLDELLPRYCDELVRAGGRRARAGLQTHVFELGLQMPQRDLGFDLLSASRLLIEQVMRSMLVKHCAARFLTGRATALVGDGRRVTGVTVETSAGRTEVAADLVVDATGANTRGPDWLASLGYERPDIQVATSAHWYVTATFARPDVWRGRDDFWLVFPTPPRTRGALMSPGAEATWRVSAVGATGDAPPANHAEVVAYAATLEDPMIAHALRDAVPLGRTTLFRKPTAAWRRYDALQRPLAGLLPIGDAMASLDPLFGQGISVATWQAVMLAGLFAQPPMSIHVFTESYLRAAAHACRSAWDLGRAAERVVPGFGESLALNAAAHRSYVEAWHLLRPMPAAAAVTV